MFTKKEDNENKLTLKEEDCHPPSKNPSLKYKCWLCLESTNMHTHIFPFTVGRKKIISLFLQVAMMLSWIQYHASLEHWSQKAWEKWHNVYNKSILSTKNDGNTSK